MKSWLGRVICLTLLGGLPSVALGQAVPPPIGAPSPAGTVPIGPPGATPPAPTAAPNNIWSFLCPTPEQCAACKTKICNSMAGQLLNNSLAPASALTGGVIPQCCPPLGQGSAYLNNPPDSALGAAARIQADEAGAKARRAAVRYLGTVNCNYWPEAQLGLINALRADRNECVRWEAAMALSRGCCCKLNIIKALVLTVSGGTADGNPSENCPRVKAAASGALAHCLSCYSEVVAVPVPKPVAPVPPVLPKPEQAPAPKPEGENVPPPAQNGQKGQPMQPPPPDRGTVRVQPIGYYQRLGPLNERDVIQEAQQVLARTQPVASSASPSAAPCRQGLVSLVESAFGIGREEPPAPPLASLSTPTNPGSLPAAFPAAPPPASASPAPPPVRRTVQEALRELFWGSETVQPCPPVPVKAPPPQDAPSISSSEVAVKAPPEVPFKAPPPLPPLTLPTPVSALPMGTMGTPAAPSSPVRLVSHEAPVSDGYHVLALQPAATVPPPVPARGPVDGSVAGRPGQPTPIVLPAAPQTPGFATCRMNGEMTAVCLETLKKAVNPFQREDAVRRLSYAGPVEAVAVVRILLDRATQDEAPLVRAACLRTLMALNVKNARVLLQQVAQQAREDRDPRVQIAAREVLEWLRADKGLVTASQPAASPTYR